MSLLLLEPAAQTEAAGSADPFSVGDELADLECNSFTKWEMYLLRLTHIWRDQIPSWIWLLRCTDHWNVAPNCIVSLLGINCWVTCRCQLPAPHRRTCGNRRRKLLPPVTRQPFAPSASVGSAHRNILCEPPLVSMGRPCSDCWLMSGWRRRESSVPNVLSLGQSPAFRSAYHSTYHFVHGDTDTTSTWNRKFCCWQFLWI